MAASTLSRRRGTAQAQARAAKERKQKMFLGAALVLLVLLMVWEVPKLMKHSGTSTSTATTTTAAATTAPIVGAPTAAAPAQTKSAAEIRHDESVVKRLASHDLFGRASAVGAEHAYQDVPAPAGVRDPFDTKSTASSSSSTTTVKPVVTPTSSAPPLPAQIVVGSAGAGKVAERGWIVILASIPTPKGRASAQSFAAHAAAKGIGGLSILNSSNSRPLRGGYWVVYEGPFKTIAQVNAHSAAVHEAGFGSAYVRQLVMYRAK